MAFTFTHAEDMAMTPRAVAYGAPELKQMAHRYWVLGIGISALIHLSIVAGYYLAGYETLEPAGRRDATPSWSIPLHVNQQPFQPGIAPAAGIHRGDIRAASGSPVPVPEGQADPEKTLPTQEDLRQAVEPRAGEEWNGIPGGVSAGDEEEPPPFVAVEKLPAIVVGVQPEYPPLALRAGLEGKVLVNIWVDRTGKVRKAVVVKTDHEMLNDAAVEAAMRFEFTPAIMNGIPVPVWVVVPFRFRIRGAG